ncbi:hypothetical protein ACXHXG_19985 [Rhizobium sp. LEGMi198b]
MNGEMIMGVQGPFSHVYYACYFGILAFAVPMRAGLRMLRDWARPPEDEEGEAAVIDETSDRSNREDWNEN